MAATGIAATFAASLAILVCPVGGAFAAPPTVQVDVANPATNPALTSSVDDPGRIAYESNVNCSVFGGVFCTATFAAVPQGQRLVIQHISGGLLFVNDPRLVLARSMHEGKHSSVTLIGCSRFGCNRQQPAWEIVVAAAGLSGRDWVGAGG